MSVLSSCQQSKPVSSEEKSTGNNLSVQQDNVQNPNPNIDVATAKSLLAQSKDIVLLDVRTKGEIALGKIGNALEMDISSPDFKENLATLDKNKEYIVYCAVGGRSARAVGIMNEMGFKNIHNLQPGYNGWIQNQ